MHAQDGLPFWLQKPTLSPEASDQTPAFAKLPKRAIPVDDLTIVLVEDLRIEVGENKFKHDHVFDPVVPTVVVEADANSLLTLGRIV